jgi:DNA replication protein DnaC
MMVRERADVEVWTAARFFGSLQEEVRFGRDESVRWIRRRAEAPVLALDDLGQEALLQARVDWAQAAFFELVDYRLHHCRPMLITTNLSARAIAAGSAAHDVRSDPLLRRLIEACEIVKFALPR